MTGLDHKRADLATREKFALTRERTQEVLRQIQAVSSAGNGNAVSGAVIISTCNRTEFYVSVTDAADFHPAEVLCQALGRDYPEYRDYFTERDDIRAIEHLYRVAAGLDSQIRGDDQIITQVREALELSRAAECTDSYLETLFRMAIHTAKMIKTEVILMARGTNSVPAETLVKLKKLTSLNGQKAVVIGNGRIGRMVSDLLIEAGVAVTVTLREFKKGDILIPEGAQTIAYSCRYAAIEQADIVVSATTSPHYTLFSEDFAKLGNLPKIVIDLAVPRDVEPSIQDFDAITLLTIDDISSNGRSLSAKSQAQIREIITTQTEKYEHWFNYKANHEASHEANQEFNHEIKQTPNHEPLPVHAGEAKGEEK